MKWLKIEVYADETLEEILTGVFLEAGAQGVNVEGNIQIERQQDEYLDEELLDAGPFHVSAFFACDGTQQNTLETIENKLNQLSGMNVNGKQAAFEIKTQQVDEDDWANAWKAYFKPTKVSNYVVIKPSWEEYTPAKDEIIVEIDPGMAFGTGTHESTRMCVQLLEEFLEPDAQVVDVGTGSGILAIAAAKLGAAKVYAMDYDGVAVDAAKKNVQMNGCDDRIQVMKSDLLLALEEEVKADMMVANIIADIVIRLSETAMKHLKRSGMLICSGIIDARLDDVIKALEKSGFKVIKIQNDGEWRAIACKYRG